MKKISKAIALSTLIITGAASSAMVLASKNNDQLVAESVSESQTLASSAAARAIVGYAREARIALFDGQIELAKDLVKKAKSEFESGLEKYAIKDAELGYVVPIDSGLIFSEGFKPSAKHTASIAEAGELMRNGDIATAMDVMTKAGVELDMNAVVLPVKEAKQKFDKAVKDIELGEYYAANLSLKTIESAIEARTYNPQALPKQGYIVEIY